MMKEQLVLDFLLDNLEPVDLETIEFLPEIEPVDIETYDELTKLYDESLYFTQSMNDTLATMLATNFSTYVKGGNPLWLYVVGPPSSGKSTLAECLAIDKQHCKSVSKFTGLHSGWKSKTGKDASLLKQIQDKTLLIKDFTTVLTGPQALQENLYGELRDAYDGTASTHYRNSISKEYDNINFTLIACVTDEVHNQNKSSLGERFLKVEIIDKDMDEAMLINKGIDNAISAITASITDDVTKNNLTHLQAATYGFMLHKVENIESFKPPFIPDWFKERIHALSKLIANLRATVSREHQGGLQYRPRSELGLRLASQLIKLAILLCYVKDKKAIDTDIYRIVKKVGLDTAKGFNYEIIDILSRAKYGLTNYQISDKLSLPETSVKRKVSDLQELGIIFRRKVSNNSGNGGRKAHIWFLSEDIQKVWETAFAYKASKGTKKKTVKKTAHKTKKTVKRKKATKRQTRTRKTRKNT